jgi:hypothetical protein
MNNYIEKLNLMKLYVLLSIIRNDVINNEDTKAYIGQLLNNEIFATINKNIFIPTGIVSKCKSNIKDDIFNGLEIISKKLGNEYKEFLEEIKEKLLFLNDKSNENVLNSNLEVISTLNKYKNRLINNSTPKGTNVIWYSSKQGRTKIGKLGNAITVNYMNTKKHKINEKPIWIEEKMELSEQQSPIANNKLYISKASYNSFRQKK